MRNLKLQISLNFKTTGGVCGSALRRVLRAVFLLESVSLKWSIFIGIFQNLEKMFPKYMEMQGNKLKIVYKSAKNTQNPLKRTISVKHLLMCKFVGFVSHEHFVHDFGCFYILFFAVFKDFQEKINVAPRSLDVLY